MERLQYCAVGLSHSDCAYRHTVSLVFESRIRILNKALQTIPTIMPGEAVILVQNNRPVHSPGVVVAALNPRLKATMTKTALKRFMLIHKPVSC